MSGIQESQDQNESNQPSINRHSTITEVFNFIECPEGGVQVVPVTVHQSESDTRLAIFIKGEHEMASIIMARLMEQINDLFDIAEQRAANPPAKSTLIVPK